MRIDGYIQLMILPASFYDECLLKIQQVNYMLKNNGRMYQSFEEASLYYQSNGRLEGNTDEILDFNRNMEFVYADRKPLQNIKNPHDYVTSNVWSLNRIK